MMENLGAVTYSIQKTPTIKPITVHVDHMKLFHTVNPPATWSEERSGSQHKTHSVIVVEVVVVVVLVVVVVVVVIVVAVVILFSTEYKQ